MGSTNQGGDNVDDEDTASLKGNDKEGNDYCEPILDTICGMKDSKTFCDIMKKLTLRNTTDPLALANILSVTDTVDGSYTVFVPTDSAFYEGVVGAIFKLTDSDLKRIVMFHFYEGVSLSYEELVCGEKISSMTEQHSMSRTKCEKEDDDGG